MTYILNIETATKNCSVSLAKNGETVLFKEIAEKITGKSIDQVLEKEFYKPMNNLYQRYI